MVNPTYPPLNAPPSLTGFVALEQELYHTMMRLCALTLTTAAQILAAMNLIRCARKGFPSGLSSSIFLGCAIISYPVRSPDV
jgi:hypothetical protein